MKKFLLLLFLFIGCDQKEPESERYVETVFRVHDIHKTKFQEDYVTFSPVGGGNIYWIKGERYKNTYNFKKGEIVLIKHNRHQNNDIKYIKLLKETDMVQ